MEITISLNKKFVFNSKIIGINNLLISLPCDNCKRTARTIVFNDDGLNGICTPKEKCGNFPGRISKNELTLDGIILNIKFNYTEFIDKTYNIKSQVNINYLIINYLVSCGSCNNIYENCFDIRDEINEKWEYCKLCFGKISQISSEDLKLQII